MTGKQAPSGVIDPVEYAECVVRRSGTSFYWAMRLLPRAKRNAMFAIYAFCREVDDIADDPGLEADKLSRLAAWSDEVGRLFGGSPRFPVFRALAGSGFDLREADFRAVIHGMEMDAASRVRIADMAELRLYCDRVACAVGRLSNRVFGIDDEQGDPLALALGQALQLTNILRDIAEDAERDRLYLPGDLLAEYGIAPGGEVDDIGPVLKHPALPELCEWLAGIAEGRFQEAAVRLACCDRRQMRPAIMMMEAYRRVLDRLNRRGWSRLDEPVGLSKVEKLWGMIRHGWF